MGKERKKERHVVENKTQLMY